MGRLLLPCDINLLAFTAVGMSRSSILMAVPILNFLKFNFYTQIMFYDVIQSVIIIIFMDSTFLHHKKTLEDELSRQLRFIFSNIK